jgi:hypothetical protein
MAATNQRKAKRTALGRKAWISFGTNPMECRVVDVSHGGARLVAQFSAEIPQKLELMFTRDGSVSRQCSIVWQTASELGVRFYQPARKHRRAETTSVVFV